MAEFLTSNLDVDYPFTTSGPVSLDGKPFAWYVADFVSFGALAEVSSIALDTPCTITINGETLSNGEVTVKGPWVHVSWGKASLIALADIMTAFIWPLPLNLHASSRSGGVEPKRVSSIKIRVADDLVYTASRVEFAQGYNMSVEAEAMANTRKTTRISFDAGRGLGAGAWSGCRQYAGIVSLGGATADEKGNIDLSSNGGCYRFEPVVTRLAGGSLEVVPGKLKVFNDCHAKCSCEEIGNFYQTAVADIAENYTDVYSSVMDARSRYVALCDAVKAARLQIETLQLTVVAVAIPGWSVSLRISVRNHTKNDSGARQIAVSCSGTASMEVTGVANVVDAVTGEITAFAASSLPMSLPPITNIPAGSSLVYNIPLYAKAQENDQSKTILDGVMVTEIDAVAGEDGRTESPVSFVVTVLGEASAITKTASCTLRKHYNK